MNASFMTLPSWHSPGFFFPCKTLDMPPSSWLHFSMMLLPLPLAATGITSHCWVTLRQECRSTTRQRQSPPWRSAVWWETNALCGCLVASSFFERPFLISATGLVLCCLDFKLMQISKNMFAHECRSFRKSFKISVHLLCVFFSAPSNFIYYNNIKNIV